MSPNGSLYAGASEYENAGSSASAGVSTIARQMQLHVKVRVKG